MTGEVVNVAAMTTKQPEFTLNRPGALIAALPAILGFVPEKSLILVAVDGGELGSVLRVDLSDALVDTIGRLADVAAAAAPAAAIAVIVDAAGACCPVCNDQHRRLIAALTEELSGHGIVLLSAHVVDQVAHGGRWHCADGCGAGGPVDDPEASPLAGVSLEAALRGEPGHRMAGLLDTALQSGLRPERIRGLADTGYRLAKQIGVKLPGRQGFGQQAG